MNQHLLPYLKIALAMSIVGSSVVAGKLIVQSFPVFLASELRFLIASLIMIPLLIKLEGFPAISKGDFFILFLQALCGVFLFSIFMLYGLTLTTALEGGIVTSTLPAVTGGLAYLLLKEKLTKQLVIGMLLAVLGTFIIQVTGSFASVERGSHPFLGNLLILGAVVGEALFIILGKFVGQRVTPLVISTMVSLFGALLFLPFAIYEGYSFPFAEVTLAEWGLIFYFGIVVTVISFLLMYQGITQVPASTAGVLTGVLPISSVILSLLILGEKMSFIHLIGMCCILTAIFLIAKHPSGKNA